ncbi:MAG TPA: hypothetical protein VMP68_08915 [Candidatus Eisenbacteria bacterium]|nr:hypothetical protein [Candidatus Eisenbacteria bacterium]
MNDLQIITFVLAVITTLLIPLVVFLVRGAVKWTRVEAKMDHVLIELKEIVADKDKVHAEIYSQMREDRAATNKRLRWLEEYLWQRKDKAA